MHTLSSTITFTELVGFGTLGLEIFYTNSEVLTSQLHHIIKNISMAECKAASAGLILGLRSANERCRYKVTLSLIG